MSDSKLYSGANSSTMPLGRKIINAPAMASNLVPGRSARPGDPSFDQNFATATAGFNRADTHHERLKSNPRTPHFDHHMQTSDGLQAGVRMS